MGLVFGYLFCAWGVCRGSEYPGGMSRWVANGRRHSLSNESFGSRSCVPHSPPACFLLQRTRVSDKAIRLETKSLRRQDNRLFQWASESGESRRAAELLKRVCVQPSTAPVNVTLLAFAAERRPCRAASIDIFWLTAANPPYAAAAVYSCDGQTDGRTDGHRTVTDILSNTMRPASLKLRPYGAIQICLLLLLFFVFYTPGSKDPRG